MKVSVIVSVYNGEAYITECLLSLAAQTLKEIEIIAVNDASTDSTLRCLQSLKGQIPNLKIISLQENIRQGGARNIGFSAAAGEYLAYCDADDWTDADMYRKLYEKAKEKDYDSVSCYYMKHHENGNISPRNTVRGWGRIYKRSMLLSNHIFFPEKIQYEDIYFQRIVQFYIQKEYLLEEYLYHYRSHENSTTHNLTEKTMRDRVEIEFMILDELERRNLEHLPFSGKTNKEFLSRCILGNTQAWMGKMNTFPEMEMLEAIKERMKTRLPEYHRYFQFFTPEGERLLRLFFEDMQLYKKEAFRLIDSAGTWGIFS